MDAQPQSTEAATQAATRMAGATYGILAAISLSHLLNDLIQALLPAIYPVIKDSFRLDFGQIGFITFVFQCTASLLQPAVGLYTDRRPLPFSLPLGMGITLCGLVLMALAPSYPVVLLAAAMIGTGSAIFHPEASRVVRMASGGRHSFAQSTFQVGGNAGTALGPLLAAFIIVPGGQFSIIYFAVVALAGIAVLTMVGRWYRDRLAAHRRKQALDMAALRARLSRGRVAFALAILVALTFSKMFYLAAIHTFYVFFMMDRFGLSVETAQVYLFVFLGATALGVLIGGPIGDMVGRRYVIWGSILGVLPFALALPHADLFWTGVLSVLIGLIIASAMSCIVVYAQDLLPGRTGVVSGLFFGLAFGMGGLGAAALGELADRTSIAFVYEVCAYLPLIGLLCWFLPRDADLKDKPAA